MNNTDVRPEVTQLFLLGPLPAEAGADPAKLLEFEKPIRGINPPLTDSEARLLVQLFGEDDCFGAAARLVTLIETAPGWPLVDCLAHTNNIWIRELRDRAIRGGRLEAK